MIKSNQKKNQKIPKMQMAEKSPNRKIVKSGKNLKIRKCASGRKIENRTIPKRDVTKK